MKIWEPGTGNSDVTGNPYQYPVRRYLVTAFWGLFFCICFFELVYIPLFGVHTDGVPIPRWQMRPIDLLFHMIHSVSPDLVEPIQAVFFCTAGVGIVGIYLGFRILSKKTVLDEPTRARIFYTIKGDPGIHFNALMQRTGINRGTLRYHLGILALTRKITCYRDGVFSRYLSEEWGVSKKDLIVACRFRGGPDRCILTYLYSHPDATRHEIGSAAGISPSNVSWRIQRFLQEGIVCSVRGEGKGVRISLTPEAEDSLRRLQGVPVPACPTGSDPQGAIGQKI